MSEPVPARHRPIPHPTCSRESNQRAGNPESRQVAWWPVYEFASIIAAGQGYGLTDGHFPIPGTPAWCAILDSDPRKLLALILRGVQASLADDAGQADMADASRAISTSPNESWRGQARRITSRPGGAYIPRRRQEHR